MENTQSRVFQTLTVHCCSRYQPILTGTPLQNNLLELWSPLNFVLPDISDGSDCLTSGVTLRLRTLVLGVRFC